MLVHIVYHVATNEFATFIVFFFGLLIIFALTLRAGLWWEKHNLKNIVIRNIVKK